MRIMIVSGDAGVPAFGRKGASTHLREMASALRAVGHEIMLAAANLDGDRRPDEDFRTATWKRPSAKWLGADVRAALASRWAGRVLAREAEAFRPDVVYERSAVYFGAGEELARRLGTPRLLEVNTLLAEEMESRLHFPRLAARHEAGLLRRAEGIAAISETMRARLVAMGIPAERVRVFTMAVAPERFAPTGGGAGRRRAVGLPDGVEVLGFVGSMNHYHKPRLFCEAFRRLDGEGGAVRALVVGGSESKVERFRDMLREAVLAERAVFVGPVPQAELGSWMEAMDLVVVPGAAPQSTPTKIFEAAAVGRPLLMPATEPIKALCGAEGEMLLFEPDSLDSLLEGIDRWRHRRGEFEAASARLRARILAEFTWEAQARRLTAWFEELRSRRG